MQWLARDRVGCPGGMSIDFTALTRIADLGEDQFDLDPAGGPGFLFGGLTMAMAVTAAARTVDGDMVPLSLRCYFLRFGVWGPARAEVERVNTSRSFAGRRARLIQGDRLVAIADMSFHRPEIGPDSQDAPQPRLAAPGQLSATEPLFGANEAIRPVEMRWPRPGPLTPRARIHPYWMRARGDLRESAGQHAAALAFMSDYLVTASPFEPGSTGGEAMNSHTLEHSLWFHRPFSAVEWLLFDCFPLTQSAGRFVSRGSIHDEGGSLVASFVQEGVIRPT